MAHAAFDDRTVTLDGPDQLARIATSLASRTRLAVLDALVRSATPLHINEVARRVGVDASPVRGHLEALVREGLAVEVTTGVGRERRFETRLRNVRLVLEGVNRAVAPEKSVPTPRIVVKLERKLAAIAEDAAALDEKARRIRREIDAAWAAASAKAAVPKS